MQAPFLVLFLFVLPTPTVSSSSSITTLPGCPDRCGNLTIPFPFGTQSGCHLPGFFVTCNSTFSSPQAFLNTGNMPVTSLSVSSATATVQVTFTSHCYVPLVLAPNYVTMSINVTGLPYALSNTRNKFTAIGCDTMALNYLNRETSIYYTSGCVSFCNELSSVINGSCSGIGCCQTSIPRGLKWIGSMIGSFRNHSDTWTFSPCSYAFLVDQEQYVFQVSDLTDFYKRGRVPVILDWAVGSNETCEAAAASSGYVCGDNSYCSNSTNAPGYHCNCQTGYQGNPYLANGCQDINECEEPETSPCSDICDNKIGSYMCSCPRGYAGDGEKSGRGCYKKTTKFPLVQVVVGSGLGLLFLLVCGFILYWVANKRRMMRLKEKFFKENGGLLLQQQLAAHEGAEDETVRIFTVDELKRATDNYADTRILGHGGNGTVYKGILPENGHIVAIKKSHMVDPMQIEQFINEVVLLSKVIHKNVVRILGCCLETQVPLLVYEYVPNGTLQYHLHKRPGSLSWESRLRIAAETAGALAYLHSAIARPIFHRDVKAANILLNHNYMAKVSDFGASRLIPLDQAQITTLVQGTLGYLDPEYFQSGQLTEKSDVYSFGVVLAEMITGQKPLSTERPHAEMNLAIYFLVKIKDGMLQEILESRVKNEGSREQLEAMSELARRCMRLKGEKRPTMTEVASEIARIMRPERGVSEAKVAEDMEEDRSMLIEEMNESIEESNSTRFYSSRNTRLLSRNGTNYFAASAIRDDSLDQHIMLSLEMQR